MFSYIFAFLVGGLGENYFRGRTVRICQRFEEIKIKQKTSDKFQRLMKLMLVHLFKGRKELVRASRLRGERGVD